MLRQHRRALGLTLENLAEQVGLTPGALSHIESGRRLPDPKNAVNIAAALGIPSEEVLQALDAEHAARRRSSAYDSEVRSAKGPRDIHQLAYRKPPPSSHAAYHAMPIEDLFAEQPRQNTSPARPDAARNVARWSDDTSARVEAINTLADTAADAIRTLRGLVGDEDPQVRREARRLLRELDVRLPEE